MGIENDVKRIQSLDVLRIVASFMVVMLHVSADKWNSVDVNQLTWKVFNLYDSAVRSCVPIFFMISGATMLGRKDMIPLPQLMKKNMLKLFIVYIAWSALYAIFDVGLRAVFSWQEIPTIIARTIGSHYHLWFLRTLIGVYLLYPVLFIVKSYHDGKYVPYCCALFFIFAVVIYTILLYPFESTLPQMLNRFGYELTGYSGYFLFGYYLTKKELPKLKTIYLLPLLFIIIGVSAKIGEVYSVSRGGPSDILYGNMSLPVFLEAIIIFILFKKIKFDLTEKFSAVIQTISKGTLTIYLLHPFLLEHFEKWFGLTTLSMNAWVSVPVICILIFTICLLISLVLTKLPLIKTWLV